MSNLSTSGTPLSSSGGVATSPHPALRFPDGELGTWACLGHTTDRTVRVWLRSPSPRPEMARLEIDGQPVAEAGLQPSPDHDYIDALDLTIDRPRPGCPFAVTVAGCRREGVLPPAPQVPAAFSFAFGSCHQPFKATPDGRLVRQKTSGIYAGMRQVLMEEDARFILLLGDQIYSDGIPNLNVRNLTETGLLEPGGLTEYYRQLYRGYFNEPGLRSILELVPSYTMWDDHDILDNWGSFRQPNDFERSAFAAATQGYVEYQHTHNPGARLSDVPPFFYSFWYADVGFLVLDLRSQRNWDAGQVMGEEQWWGLETFLADAADRDTRTVFVAATIPAVHFPPVAVRLLDGLPGSKGGNIRDRWDSESFQPQRDRLLHILCDWQAEGAGRQAIILSGDVHAGAAFRVQRKQGPGQVLQWTSSSMTAPIGLVHILANNLGTAAVNLGEKDFTSTRDAVQARNNFGVVRVEPLGSRDQPGHRISFSLYKYHSRRRRVTPSFTLTYPPQ